MHPHPATNAECLNRMVLQGIITAEQAQRALTTPLAEHAAELQQREPVVYPPEVEARLLAITVPLQ